MNLPSTLVPPGDAFTVYLSYLPCKGFKRLTHLGPWGSLEDNGKCYFVNFREL